MKKHFAKLIDLLLILVFAAMGTALGMKLWEEVLP